MSILHSYRWRRRIAFTAIVLGVAGPLIWLGVRYSNPGNPENANGPTVADYEVSKNVPFTPAQRQEVHKVLRQFIATAVVRHDIAKAWDIAGPTLKEGVTRKQWDNGDLPVVPYPAANKGWGKWSFVQYSYTEAQKHTVGLEVFLFPKPNSGWSAMTADVEVVRGKDGRWLVDYWMPKRFHGPPAVAQQTKADAKKLREQHAAKAKAKAEVNAKASQGTQTTPDKPLAHGGWWALPVGLLGLAILIPLTVGGFVWYRNRKAERAYFRSATHDNPSSRT
jgi:hypothetical protein